jgi:hypothetical protein
VLRIRIYSVFSSDPLGTGARLRAGIFVALTSPGTPRIAITLDGMADAFIELEARGIGPRT